jgi:hypothetical protein
LNPLDSSRIILLVFEEEEEQPERFSVQAPRHSTKWRMTWIGNPLRRGESGGTNKELFKKS